MCPPARPPGCTSMNVELRTNGPHVGASLSLSLRPIRNGRRTEAEREEKKECKFRTSERNAPGRSRGKSSVRPRPSVILLSMPPPKCTATLKWYQNLTSDDARDDGASCKDRRCRRTDGRGRRTIKGGMFNGTAPMDTRFCVGALCPALPQTRSVVDSILTAKTLSHGSFSHSLPDRPLPAARLISSCISGPS